MTIQDSNFCSSNEKNNVKQPLKIIGFQIQNYFQDFHFQNQEFYNTYQEEYFQMRMDRRRRRRNGMSVGHDHPLTLNLVRFDSPAGPERRNNNENQSEQSQSELPTNLNEEKHQ